MTEAVLEGKTVNVVGCDVSNRFDKFAETVNNDSTLELFDAELTDDGDSLIIRNTAIKEGTDGAFIRVSTDEIASVNATQIIDCIKMKRKPIVCNGITRIVGYYSRMSNWNKSKIGELRDRNQQNYALGGATPEHDDARHKAINGLG